MSARKDVPIRPLPALIALTLASLSFAVEAEPEALALALSDASGPFQSSPSGAPGMRSRSSDARSGAFWRVYVSPVTGHFSHSDDHHAVFAGGIERYQPDGFMVGAAGFRNSFGQPSANAYLGRRLDGVADIAELFVSFSGGVLYGYKDPYESKVPLNNNSVSPGAVAAIGWRLAPAFFGPVEPTRHRRPHAAIFDGPALNRAHRSG